jgi:hypothetical protein
MKDMKKDRTVKVVLIIVIVILLALLLFQIIGKDEVRIETVETEQVQPGKQEAEASKELEEDLSGLTSAAKTDTKSDQSSIETKSSQRSSTETSSEIQGGIFKYKGKPDLSFVQYDFGIYLTPVTKGSKIYVPIKFITKKYIKKLVPQIPGLKENSVPKTDKANPEGRPPGKSWSLDKSGTVYFFVDFGQKVKRTNNSSVQIPLNAYAGQKPGGYEIWLMYEAAVLNKQGFTQKWDGGNFVSNGDDGYDYAGIFKGFK